MEHVFHNLHSSRLEVGEWIFTCKKCYQTLCYDEKCTVCLRYRSILKDSKPYDNSVLEPIVCRSCYRKLNSDLFKQIVKE